MRKFVSSSQIHEDVAISNEEEESIYFDKMLKLREKEKLNGFDLEFQSEKILCVPKKRALTEEMFAEVESLFKNLYPVEIEFSPFIKRITRLSYLKEIYATKTYKGENSPYSQCTALYTTQNVSDVSEMEKRPAIILDLFEVTLHRNGDSASQVAAFCRFFKKTDQINHYGVNSSLKIWSKEFEVPCLIPIKYIYGRFVYCKEEIIVGRLRNVPISNTFNVVVKLPSKSIL